MSAITNTISGLVNTVAKAVGMGPDVSSIMANPVSSVASSATAAASGPSAADLTAQQQAAGIARGTSSTLLNGTEGVDPDKLQTSKVLLGQ
jgi:hypothetical protein